MSTRPDWRRSHTCGELRSAHLGQEVVLNGWVHARRDHGGIYFIDLRDRHGITQIVLGEELTAGLRVGPEYVLSVRGEVRARGPGNVNPGRPTGEIELAVTHVEVLSEARVPPFEVRDDLEASTELRLRYRYIDLRRGPMQKQLEHRSRFVNAMRRAFEQEGFLEIETPILTKATPEGARDYLVPSRIHPGEFYALPQSPQLFKQLLMVGGCDRYFQVARCFRDEDLRADRQPEFTQLDMEMSFVEEDDIWEIWERVLAATFEASMGVKLETPFPRMRHAEALARYGLDKPDTRFGMELVALDDWARTSDFKVFSDTIAAGGRVLGMRVEQGGELSRKDIGALEEVVKAYGAKGLAWWKAGAEGGAGPLARFAAGDGGARLMALMGANEGDLCVFVADVQRVAQRALGELRVHLGKKLGLLEAGRWDFLWITHFPMFEWDEDSRRWFSSHHPFTAPEDWNLEGSDLGALSSRAYDLVLNGIELGSGSVRIHRQDVQQRVFELLGIGPKEQRQKFGFLLEALSYGAPPHAGFAIGLDRVVMLTAGLDNIREVIAFPKTASASDLLCDAPSVVPEEQLEEVHIRLAPSARRTIESAPQPAPEGGPPA